MDATSGEINAAVEASMHRHAALYALDDAALAAVEPDLILTQELCRVCAVGYREVNEVARRLDGDVTRDQPRADVGRGRSSTRSRRSGR